MNTANTAQIAARWKTAAAGPAGWERNEVFWACVDALKARGFIGDARRFLERVARWAR